MSHEPGSVLKPLVKLGKRPDDCWDWLGFVTDKGVATKQTGPRHVPARRWMWQQLFGPIPDGLVVTTTCGSKVCCNPHHLRCCFQADANRLGAGVTLLASDVAEIRKAGKERSPNMAKQLAERYGVSPGTIRDVWNRRSWNARKAPNRGPNQREEA